MSTLRPPRAFRALLVEILILSGSRVLAQIPPVVPEILVQPTSEPVLSSAFEPRVIFQRAFWRHPTADDKIIHAKRNEWKDKQGVTRWEWYLVVEPSPDLIRHLFTENVFGLIPASDPASLASLDERPEWFPASPPADHIRINPSATLRFYLDSATNRLYATGSGAGFRPGIPEVSIQPTEPQKSGRLPREPPPRP